MTNHNSWFSHRRPPVRKCEGWTIYLLGGHWNSWNRFLGRVPSALIEWADTSVSDILHDYSDYGIMTVVFLLSLRISCLMTARLLLHLCKWEHEKSLMLMTQQSRISQRPAQETWVFAHSNSHTAPLISQLDQSERNDLGHDAADDYNHSQMAERGASMRTASSSKC